MKKELHPTISIFHLKNNYKWTDKPELEKEDAINEINIVWDISPEHKVKIAQNYINSAQAKKTIL